MILIISLKFILTLSFEIKTWEKTLGQKFIFKGRYSSFKNETMKDKLI